MFKIGDKAALVLGGPTLTVIGVSPTSGRVWCEWLDADDETLNDDSFAPETLRLVDGN
jgi:uncharacterized protein YodC (DUF2158 family)